MAPEHNNQGVSWFDILSLTTHTNVYIGTLNQQPKTRSGGAERPTQKYIKKLNMTLMLIETDKLVTISTLKEDGWPLPGKALSMIYYV